jgi:hypothetical protein
MIYLMESQLFPQVLHLIGRFWRSAELAVNPGHRRGNSAECSTLNAIRNEFFLCVQLRDSAPGIRCGNRTNMLDKNGWDFANAEAGAEG